MHSFVSPSEVSRFRLGTIKVAKPVKVQLAQIIATPTNEVVLGSFRNVAKQSLWKASWFVAWMALKPS